ncbi:MAG: hypothetical protein AAFO88_07780 [Pseudomonadota bacterium]
MGHILAYLKILVLTALAAALYPALALIWTGALPPDLGKLAATLGLVAALGFVVTLLSLPGKPPADKQPV